MKSTRWLWRGLAAAGIGAVGGAAAVTLSYVLQTPQPLRSGLKGDARIDRGHGGDLYYTVAGSSTARPLVLLHGFYPGGFSYEYECVVPLLARDFRVYALDWLGFGMSEHPALAYTGEFYATILTGFLRDVIGGPAIVLASGGAANVAARAASDEPALFERLALISPQLESGLHLDPALPQTLVRLAERLSLGLVPYALLSTRPVLRWQASRWGLGATGEDVLDHEFAAAHQFGAQYAPLAALDGELDQPLQHLLPTLEPPLLLVAGEHDLARSRDDMEEIAVMHPYTDLDIIPGAGCAVCQDQATRFVRALTTWTQREPPRHVSTDTLRVGSPDAMAVGNARRVQPLSRNRRSNSAAKAGLSAPAVNGVREPVTEALDKCREERTEERRKRPEHDRRQHDRHSGAQASNQAGESGDREAGKATAWRYRRRRDGLLAAGSPQPRPTLVTADPAPASWDSRHTLPATS